MEPREPSELAYLLRREADERALANAATEPAKPLHVRLADAYVKRINEWLGERSFERKKQRDR